MDSLHDHRENDVFDEIYFSDEGEKDTNSDDEAIEDNTLNADGEKRSEEPKPVKVKRPVLNPQPKLNFQALQGPKGLLALNSLFADFKFRGSGYELEDLSAVLKGLDQWAYRLFPMFHFEDSLKRMEALGKKREVQVYLKKIRSGMIDNDDIVRQVDDDDDELQPPLQTHDAFDDLLSQQIARTQPDSLSSLSDEQKARIERNKRMAMEKRMQKKVLSPAKSPGVDLEPDQQMPSTSAMISQEAVEPSTEAQDVDIEISDIQMPSTIEKRRKVQSTTEDQSVDKEIPDQPSTSAMESQEEVEPSSETQSMDVELPDQPMPSTSAMEDVDIY